jgi:hypothetical protein
MKTIEAIKKEREQIIKSRGCLGIKEYNKAEKKVRLLTECVFYLETKPRPEFIKESYNKTKTRISIIKERFIEYKTNTLDTGKTISRLKSEWYSLNRMNTLKFQLSILKYLLSE